MNRTEKNMKFNVIAAACENMGIGNKGTLPWRLRKEMQYFSKITSTTNDSSKCNAVIMGRNTWNSIPSKFRPLQNRLNIVISNSMKESGHENVPVYGSLMEAVSKISKQPLSEKIETIWIIGGSQLYKEAINSLLCENIYLTKILHEFECDTFFPDIPESFVEIQSEGIPSELHEENGINFRYTIFNQKI